MDAFDDRIGNSYAGITSTTAWSFTTDGNNAPIAGCGNALDCEGSDDNIHIGNGASLNFSTSSFTLDAWVKFDNALNSRFIGKYKSDDYGWIFGTSASGYLILGRCQILYLWYATKSAHRLSWPDSSYHGSDIY